MKEFYRAANVIVMTTVDGMEHMYHFAKNLVVHGGQGSGVDALEGLREGNTVVVHYTVSGQQEFAQEIDQLGDEGLRTTEGKSRESTASGRKSQSSSRTARPKRCG